MSRCGIKVIYLDIPVREQHKNTPVATRKEPRSFEGISSSQPGRKSRLLACPRHNSSPSCTAAPAGRTDDHRANELWRFSWFFPAWLRFSSTEFDFLLRSRTSNTLFRVGERYTRLLSPAMGSKNPSPKNAAPLRRSFFDRHATSDWRYRERSGAKFLYFVPRPRPGKNFLWAKYNDL